VANKPTVTATLVGDEKRLTDAFDAVGTASKRMTDTVSQSSRGLQDMTTASDRASEAADTAETRFTGFYDTIGGARDAIAAFNDDSLSMSDRLVALGQAGADLAGGLVGFVIPAVSGLWQRLLATSAAQWVLNAAQTAWTAITGAATTAMAALNAVMRANPIMTVITIVGLLVGAFILLWNKSAGFRNFFIGMWNGIKATVGAVVGWIRDRWNGLVSWFTNIPGRIGSALGSLGGIVKNVFKGAVNGIVDALNWFLDHSINWLINRVNDISGVIGVPAIPTIPHIPRMHTGGVVPGSPGQERLAILQAGEKVTGRGSAASRTVTLNSGGSAFGKFILKVLQEAIRDQGGNVAMVLGS
jgi:phage-related protein